MQVLKIAGIVLVFICFGGCAGTQITRNMSTSKPQLNPDASIFVALPANGVYDSTVYANSSEQTASAVAAAFIPYVKNTHIGKTVQSQKQAQQTASSLKCEYMIYPKIMHWEDRATTWSGKTDHILINIKLFNTDTQTTLDNVLIKGHSAWFTFGGDHPQDLLAKPLDNYASSLFANRNTK